MKFLAVAISIGGVVGCAGPAAFETAATEGHVVAKETGNGGPSGPVSQTLLVPVGNVFIPLDIATAKQSSQYHLYTVKYGAEHELITQSVREFQIGDCVRLWHAPLTVSAGPDYKFVAGTLESFAGCK